MKNIWIIQKHSDYSNDIHSVWSTKERADKAFNKLSNKSHFSIKNVKIDEFLHHLNNVNSYFVAVTNTGKLKFSVKQLFDNLWPSATKHKTAFQDYQAITVFAKNQKEAILKAKKILK